MKHLIFLLVYGFITSFCIAQAPAILWQKCLGGSSQDDAYSIAQTADGGYIVAGQAWSNNGDVSGNHGGNGDYWITKIDAVGNLQWQKCLGGSTFEIAYSVQQTTDGGYIVAGFSTSNNGDVSGNHGGYDSWIVKLSATGSIQWQKCLGGSSDDVAKCIQQTTDGGYIIAGYATSNDGDVSGKHGIYTNDSWIVKLNATGGLQWQKCLGGSDNDQANSIQQTIDGGYIIAGYTSSNDGDVSGNHGGRDSWVVKLSATGSIQWQKCLGGSGSDNASFIQQTTDGGYIMAGWSSINDGDVSGNHGGSDSWVVKLSATGSIQWQKCLGGSGTEDASSIQQTTDGGYIMAGWSSINDGDVSGNHGGSDSWVVKLSATGSIQWQKCLGGSSDDAANCIQQTTDGGYIIAGYTTSNDGDVSGKHGGRDSWVTKLSSSQKFNVELKWDNSFPTQLLTVKGVAADGVSRIYLKVSKGNTNNTPAIQNVKVSLLNGVNSDISMLGKVQMASIINSYSTEANNAYNTFATSSNAQNGDFWFWYVAPDDFSNDALSAFANTAEREVKAHVVITFADSTKDSTDVPIKVVRPPLVMVHGIASNEHCWDNFHYGSGTLFIDSPLFKQKKAVNLLPHTYFEINANILLSPDATQFTMGDNRLNTLQGNIEALRKQGYACNQVDYVCHSMGGCVLRTAATIKQNKFYGLDNSPYKNYEKGFVHKTIFLNTPHQNTPLADAISEFIPQAPFYINYALGIIYTHFPNTPMVFEFVQPLDFGQPYDTWSPTPSMVNLQVSNEKGGISLQTTNVKNHLLAGDVDIYSAQTAEILTNMEPYMELIDCILKIMRDVSPPGLVKNTLTAMLALEKAARVFTFIEWYSAQKGFPNYLGDGDLAVPLKSQLAGLSPSTTYTTIFQNSGNTILDANHSSMKNRDDVGNRVKDLLNSAVGSNLFGTSIPATPSSGFRLATGDLRLQETNRTQTSRFDTSKIKIIIPSRNSNMPADSTRMIQIKLKDTIGLAYLNLAFQGKSRLSIKRDSTQTFTLKVDSSFLGSQIISVTAAYDKVNGTDYYTDTVTVNVTTNAVLTGFTAKEDTNHIYNGQAFYPIYTAKYANYNAGIPTNSPDILVNVANTALVQYNTAQHAFYAIADTGTTRAIVTYKGFKDTIAFVLVPQLYSGCINRTASNTTLRSSANWTRGVIPTPCDSVIVMPGHILMIDSSIQIRSLYISPGATVVLADSIVKLQIGEADDGNQSFINYGSLTINNGKVAINGSLQLMAGSNFTMTAGEIILDGNTGYAATSLSEGKNIFNVSNAMNNFSFTGGTLQIIDPPSWSNSQSISCPFNFGDISTLKFGNGISTTASNNPNGFGGNLMPTKIGKLVLDAVTTSNNRIFTNLNPLTIKSSVQVKSGNLVQKAAIQVVQ